MVSQHRSVADITHRQLTSRCKNAFFIVALTILMIAAITDYIMRKQIDNAKDIENAQKTLILSQRIAFNVQQLFISNLPTERNKTLQALARAIRNMEEMRVASQADATYHAAGKPHDIYYAAPYHIHKRVHQYLADANTVLHTPADTISPDLPVVKNLLAQADGSLYENLQFLIRYEQTEQLSSLHGLSYVVYALSLLVILVLFAVDMVILRPAISYISQAQLKLKELNQLKSDFLANMSHEIRTPMNGIFGMAELLKESEINERQQHYVRTLQNSADHLLGLINDILDFSKMEAGQMKLDPVRFNLLETIEEVMEVLSPRAREKNLELLLHYPPGTPCSVVADPGRIRQVLFNLIGNAIKFTDTGYVITHVTILPIGNKQQFRLGIRIEDTGIGIPEDKIASLFEKFMQVESGSTRARQGTGLGLAISRNLVQLMGGDITVESTPGKGTAFSWHIKVTEAAEPVQENYHHAAFSGKRILFVDDLKPNRQLFKEMFIAAGMQCLVAENAREALSMLDYEYDSKRHIDAVITDDLMPGVSGTELCTSITQNERYATIPILLLSAARPEDIRARLNDGAVKTYLAKPVSYQQLLDALKRLFEGRLEEIAPAAAKPQMQIAQTQTTAMQWNILLVEDNKVNLEIISEMLSQMGCSVTTAENGRLALEKIKQQPFDLVFMDCQMPEMDGFEAATHIRTFKQKQYMADIPIVALTANALKGDRERCLASGMDDYVSKPVQKMQLRATLDKWLSGKGKSENRVSSLPLPVAEPLQGSSMRAVGIDLSAFTAARDVLGDKFSKVLSYYLEDAESYIDHIAEALKREDLHATVRPAHTLKSSSQQFGAIGLASLAARIEQQAQENTDTQTGKQLASLIIPMREALQQARQFYFSAGTQF